MAHRILISDPLNEAGLEILLLFYSARIRAGVPTPREGQEVAWVAIADLDRYPTPPADVGIVEILQRSLHIPATI